MADHDEEAIKLALLAHDLRTPLAAMRLTADLIGNGPLNEAQSQQLAILTRSIDALTDMTGELVKEARSGSEEPSAGGSAADILIEVTGLFQLAAEAKGLFLETSVDDGALAFQIHNAASFRRVVTTLLDNAIKYTSAGGVSVRLEPCGCEAVDGAPAELDRVKVIVTDSGPGIDPEEAARLFRPFVRGRQGRATGEGSGLGLWGTELLVRQLQGRITLDRADEGGSRFVVELPANADTGAVTDKTAPGTGGGLGQSALQGLHVLVVDDNETNCRLLAALLESFGVTADVAGSGSQAIALVEKADYDAVLLDLHMPDMSGVDTAERLGALPKGKALPLIAVTAALESAGDASLRAAGFQETLTKPLSPTALYDALSKVRD
ncbi:hybrid sensor histidine kinase/response regulator [Labrenzia sp. VG12]|uniref:ATP-binding response regulator n=1 Tax=Labrenzia sp. VG12 TaxID=2021862 RepID=UPI000B8C4448|nr:hybrid sensor histidine kinase/response regulator [Labrenzia sp. VG12]ASP34966.1 hybrid sensor histidine kinase/response regulator [Labrenzia sp. VG12]